jgi:arsenate reductase
MKILILCTGNTCRSQMAEGYLQDLDNSLELYSAGVDPGDVVNPVAVKVMEEKGIDISGRKSNDVDEFIDESFDFVITVCDNARETCPVFIGKVKHNLHIGFEDPAEFEGTDEAVMNKYREIRDLIFDEFGKWYKEIRK